MVARRRVVIIGAGPIGLTAALLAVERGFEVTVLEQGEVGDALKRWDSVRLFTPLAMNLPGRARSLMAGRLPPDDTLVTGPELAERVLEPLSRLPLLAGRIRERHRVLAIGRDCGAEARWPAIP